MKRTTILLLILCWSGSVFAADTVYEDPFVPVTPEVFAQGGSFIANAHGFNALFYNPAGFAVDTGEKLTILTSTAWVYANPARFLRAMGDMSNDPQALTSFAEREITTGGVGFGLSEGIGWVGNGLGLGLILDLDSYIYGPTVLGAVGDLNATLAFVAGFALPVNILGINVIFGGDLRPMMRISAPFQSTDLFTMISTGDPLTALNSVQALHGFGLAIDLGTIIEFGNFKVGLAARDFLGTRWAYTESAWSGIWDSLGSGSGFPEGSEVAERHVIPMDLSAGVAWHPNLGELASTIDPTIHASLNDVIGVIRDKRSPWTLLHIGTEVELFRFMRLRAGFNQGYLTAGLGMHLLFFDINTAFFTREMGKHLGDQPNSGMTVEAAIRF